MRKGLWMISVYATVVGVSEAKDTAKVVCVTLLRLPWCFASIETTRLNNSYKGREPRTATSTFT